MSQIIKKSLAGLEDLALGTGLDSQTRGESTVDIHRISTDWVFTSVADIKALNTALVQHTVLVALDNTRVSYDYLSSATIAGNDTDVLQPNSGVGRWLLRRENNRQVQTYAQGSGGINSTTHNNIPAGFIVEAIFDDNTDTLGSGNYYHYTGTTDTDKAGDWPNADLFYYDIDGKQFATFGSSGGGGGGSSTLPDVIDLPRQTTTPATVANTGRLYSSNVNGVAQLFYLDSAGVPVQVTNGQYPAAGISTTINVAGNSRTLLVTDFAALLVFDTADDIVITMPQQSTTVLPATYNASVINLQ